MTQDSRKLRYLTVGLACALGLMSATALASGPRWVTGAPYFTTSAQPVIWYTTSPTYFTDPGDLSASVDHASADALVAAAASVWNVPTSSLVLAQGGQLAEHVSSANVYLGANGPVFPADVSAANYATKQIAVIYDTDGSVTDLLLGQGASDPDSCRQNGVTESVDSISPNGTIQHALLILNGRCSGPAPEQQLQVQYQLMRAFGRVLGLAWSQTNDNVFTQTPFPTPEDVSKWPIMHPIDIICGNYTYQCQPQPFTLRPDDVASISQLYFINKGTAPAGKVDTLSNANTITGVMQFGNGQGMQGVNLLVRRKDPVTPYLEASPVVSAVTGNLFRWSNGNPVTGSLDGSSGSSMGTVNAAFEGAFKLAAIPFLPHANLQDIFVTSEPINPLYTGQYGIGPYLSAPVTPSGPAFPWEDHGVVPYETNHYVWTVPGSVATCAASGLGTRSNPAPAPSSGWWTGVLCGYGVSAWPLLIVKANRSLTVEATALDEQGLATENKLLPLIGAWNQSDPVTSLPTLAATPSPFNSIAAGLTSLSFDTPQAGPLRLAITDQRGDGRPDYTFRARILYADTVAPSVVPASGGLVLITGMGFRPGLAVTVGGASATVVSSTATSILAIAPPFATLPDLSSLTLDVVVTDRMSGGSTAMYGALSYPAAALPSQTPNLTILRPAFYVAAEQQVAFTPQATVSNAGAFTAGVPVTWTSNSGSFSFPNGGQTLSDSDGIASIVTTVAPLQAGALPTGSACAQFNGQTQACGSFSVNAVDPSQWTLTVLNGASQSIAATSILQPVAIQVTDGSGNAVIGAPVDMYQAITGFQVCPADGRCPTAPVYSMSHTSAVSDGNGLIIVSPIQLTGSAEVTTIAAATGTQGFLSVSLQKVP